ncbi:MAG: uncharacterized membrane-anchored protein YhcB (DUF1043 family) [Crocinitomicaceae bacterium]|jgi:uncharacterized membrane-anchored protein YhcB (DUF1043 family)
MSAQIISSLLILAVGVGLGVLLQRYVLSRGTDIANLEKELDILKGQQLQAKDSLQQHFLQTAGLTQDLTNSYKALYEHLASGASEFTEKPLADLKHALEQANSDGLPYENSEDYQINDEYQAAEEEENQAPKDYAAREHKIADHEKKETTPL